MAVICTLLGVPVEDGPLLLGWSHAIVKMYELHTGLELKRAAERASDEFIGYVRRLIRARRAHPRSDLISQLIQVADQGDRLTDDEIVCTVIVLLNAGHEATVNTLGNGMRALLTHPDQWRRVVSGRGRADHRGRGDDPLGRAAADVRAVGARGRRRDRRPAARRRRSDRDAVRLGQP